MGQRTVVGVSPSKVVALIATLLAVEAAIMMLFTEDVLQIVLAIIVLVASVIFLVAMNVFDLRMRKNLPYEWWVVAIMALLFIIFIILGAGALLLATILMVCAFLIELLSDRKSYTSSKLLVIVGAGWTIYEAILLLMSEDVMNIILAIIGIICAVFLLLSLLDNSKLPYAWWYVLMIGWVLFAFISIIGGTIVLVGFILILMAY